MTGRVRSLQVRDRRDLSVRRADAREHQRGLTLIETIIAVALLALGIVGVTKGIAVSQQLASTNQDQSQLEVAMRQLTDFVRDSNPTSGLAYNQCSQVTTAVSASSLSTTSVGSGTNPAYSAQLSSKLTKPTNVGEWGFTSIYESKNGVHDGTATAALWTTNCPAGTGDWGVQEVKITVFDTTGLRSLTRTVWKSYAWCYQGSTATAC